MMSGSKTLNFGVIMKLKKYDIIAIICVAVIVIIKLYYGKFVKKR